MRVVVGVIVVLFLACLAVTTWAIVLPSPRGAQVGPPLDHSRPLPQGGWYTGAFSDPKHLNPFTTNGYVARNHVLRYTHDTLMRLDPQTGRPVPGLGTPIQTSPDGRRVVFQLRPDARFADGSPVTPADVLFTWEVVQDQSVRLGSMTILRDRLRGVDALGGSSFELVLNKRYFAGVEAVALEYSVVKRQHFLDRIRALAEFERAPVPGPGQEGFGNYLGMVRHPGPGTGPYKIAQWEHGEELILVQNPHSWHRQAYPECWNLAGLKLRLGVTDPVATFTLWRNQKIDWHYDPDPEALLARWPDTAQSYRLFRYEPVGIRHQMVVWNHRRPYLKDPLVRRALTMLFDREQIASKYLHGLAKPAVAWFRPGEPEYPKQLRPWPFDPDAARKLLEETGFGPDNPLTLEIMAPNEDSLYRRILDLARPAFRRAGVKLTAPDVDFAVVKERRAQGDWDGYFIQWRDPGPAIDAYEVFHSSMIGEQGHNFGGYRNADVDRILAQAQRELDPKARAELLQEFNRIFHDEQPVSLLVHLQSAFLLHTRFQDASPGALGLVPRRWWVAPKR